MKKVVLLFITCLFFSCKTLERIEFSSGKYMAKEKIKILKNDFFYKYVLELKPDSTFNLEYVLPDYGKLYSFGVWHHSKSSNTILLNFDNREDNKDTTAITKKDLGGFWEISTRKIKILNKDKIKLEIKMNKSDKSTVVLLKTEIK